MDHVHRQSVPPLLSLVLAVLLGGLSLAAGCGSGSSPEEAGATGTAASTPTPVAAGATTSAVGDSQVRVSFGAFPFDLGTPPPGETWRVAPEGSRIKFAVAKSTGAVVEGTFPGGVSGWLVLQPSGVTGRFAVDLSTVKTGIDLRDQTLVQSIFGREPQGELAAAIDAAWQALEGKVARGSGVAGFALSRFDGGIPAHVGDTTTGIARGTLYLWDSVALPVGFPYEAKREMGKVTVKGTAPVVLDLVEILGRPTRDLLYATMVAAGCPHQMGIQRDVVISLESVVFTTPEAVQGRPSRP